MPAFSFGMFLPLSMLSESISLLWLRFSSLYFQSTVPTKNRQRLIVCSLNVIIFLLTMPLWRKPRKSLYVLQISDGVICMIESHNCMVHTVQEKKVVIQGLDGYIIAENNDTLLICKLSEEQRIKQFSGQDK